MTDDINSRLRKGGFKRSSRLGEEFPVKASQFQYTLRGQHYAWSRLNPYNGTKTLLNSIIAAQPNYFQLSPVPVHNIAFENNTDEFIDEFIRQFETNPSQRFVCSIGLVLLRFRVL